MRKGGRDDESKRNAIHTPFGGIGSIGRAEEQRIDSMRFRVLRYRGIFVFPLSITVEEEEKNGTRGTLDRAIGSRRPVVCPGRRSGIVFIGRNYAEETRLSREIVWEEEGAV